MTAPTTADDGAPIHHLHPRWTRLGRVVLVFAIAGWLTAALVMATDKDRVLSDTLVDAFSFQSAIAATIGALAWGPLLAWTRIKWLPAMLVGLPAGLTTLYVFFFIWPHSWQPGRLDAWKAVALFTKVYWRYLLPMSCGAASLSAIWAARPVRRPSWMDSDPD